MQILQTFSRLMVEDNYHFDCFPEPRVQNCFRLPRTHEVNISSGSPFYHEYSPLLSPPTVAGEILRFLDSVGLCSKHQTICLFNLISPFSRLDLDLLDISAPAVFCSSELKHGAAANISSVQLWKASEGLLRVIPVIDRLAFFRVLVQKARAASQIGSEIPTMVGAN